MCILRSNFWSGGRLADPLSSIPLSRPECWTTGTPRPAYAMPMAPAAFADQYRALRIESAGFQKNRRASATCAESARRGRATEPIRGHLQQTKQNSPSHEISAMHRLNRLRVVKGDRYANHDG